MQFVNIYVRADSSIIETDNIWHYKHILQYIVISNHHYFPVCNQNCVSNIISERTPEIAAQRTPKLAFQSLCDFMLLIFIHSNFHVIRTLSYDCSLFYICQFFTYSFEDLIKTSAIVLYLLFWASNWLNLLDPVQYTIRIFFLSVN